MNIKKYIFLIILSTFIYSLNSCTPAHHKQSYIKDGKEYGVTKGLFRGRWWNYYERGLSFAMGDFLNNAEIDFKEALKQRSMDQRTARTYGMHFVDYFPHRELGIIFYKQGLFQEAVNELELSLSTQDSAKAKFFLNKARKSYLKTRIETDPGNRDRTPPEIFISTPEKNGVTNKFFIQVSGKASDTNYVGSVNINGMPEFIELSSKEIEFKKKVELVPGLNEIAITARDLLGNINKISFTVMADYQGPNLSVLNFVNNQHTDKREITINLSYSDESGLGYVALAGSRQFPKDRRIGTISARVKLKNGKNVIKMEACDNAGNKTMGEISIIYSSGPRFAVNDLQTASDEVYLAPKTDDFDKQPPEINFSGLMKILSDHEPLTITARKKDNFFFIEGMASDKSGIEEIHINEIPVFFITGKSIVFNKLVDFKEGNNQFKIFARDSKGNTATKSIIVNRLIQQIDIEESRMTISIMPFKDISTSPGLADSIYNLFMQEIINSQRFHVIERGPDFETILKELKLSQTDLVDREKAVQAGRLMASEAIMIGNIVENKNEVEIYAKLINTETSEFLTIQDVYGQDKSRTNLENLLAGLASKIVYSIPLIEGEVLAVKGDEFFLDIGKKKHFNIKKGVKCLVYRNIPFIVDGVKIGDDTSILGTLILNRVNPDFSSALVYGAGQVYGQPGAHEKGEKIEIRKFDKVVTK